MPITTLTFNLPEEQDEAARALKCESFYFAIQDFAQELRQIIKYRENEDEVKKAEWAREKLLTHLEDLNNEFGL